MLIHRTIKNRKKHCLNYWNIEQSFNDTIFFYLNILIRISSYKFNINIKLQNVFDISQ